MVVLRNPLSFTSFPITSIVSIVYAAALIPLIIIHFKLPPAPTDESLPSGLNLTEAWSDLQFLSNGFHPYNSRRNDEVRDWLLHRINAIVKEGNVSAAADDDSMVRLNGNKHENTTLSPVVIFNDIVSNVSFSWPASSRIHTYFEGTNILVYIRGTQECEQSDWWKIPSNDSTHGYRGIGGILVNAHYDSVSTGYGATDDGVGVVSILQLISYFTQKNQRPKRGIVALFNNGEEDYLNGAYAFTQHPLAGFPSIFLNLEGAGAGGRAALFRSTDTEVTRFYKNTEHPFGTVISADGFKRGLVKSETDYAIFTNKLGLRGLDVAFIGPRSKYHTTEDDVKDTSKRALWHMLAAAFHTVKSMSNDVSDSFEKGNHNENAQSQFGTVPVWFDMFGQAFVLLQLHSLFAISVTLLVVSPLILAALMFILKFANRWYLFSRHVYCHSSGEGDEPVEIKGFRGFSRYPLAFIIATATVVGEAFLITNCNAPIIQSSPYSIWGMMLSTWLVVIWFFLRGAAKMRPTAFDRVYALLWIYIIFFILTTAATILENNFQISGVYFLVVYFAASFAALSVAYLELFALPPMLRNVTEDTHSPTLVASEPDQTGGVDDEHEIGRENATESTSLIGNEGQQTFVRYGTGGHNPDEVEGSNHSESKLESNSKQDWSKRLPAFLWVAEFLLLAPINIILVGQICLFVTAALSQTLADGSSPLLLYLDFAVLSVLLLLPLSAFINRITFPLPTLLFVLLLGTLTYNLLAFPFSRTAKLKMRIGQHVDLDSGNNTVYLSGIPGYINPIVASLPSASGQEVDCVTQPIAFRSYAGLATCGFTGLPPDVLKKRINITKPSEIAYKEWINFSMKRTQRRNEATIQLQGKNTRACRIYFNQPVKHIEVIDTNHKNATLHTLSYKATFESEEANGAGPEIDQVRLWSRKWDGKWEVRIRWEPKAIGEDRGDDVTDLDGRVACLWSDANERGTIPAFDEAVRFVPVWVGLTKLDDGLVIGSKRFSV